MKAIKRSFSMLLVVALVFCVFGTMNVDKGYASSGNDEISFYDDSLTIKLGETKRIIVYTDNGGAVVYSTEDDVISCEWGDWLDDCNDTYLYVTGEYLGTTTLTVYDELDESVSATINVEVVEDDSDSQGGKAATETKTLKGSEYIIDFNMEYNYKLTLTGKDYHLLWGVEDIASFSNSNKSVAKVSRYDYDYALKVVPKLPGKTVIKIKDVNGNTNKITLTVKLGKAKVESTNWVYKNSKSVKVKAYNVKKGDVLKLKIGKKTYTKKIKKTAFETSVKFSIKKPGFYGKKYNLTLKRGGKVVAKESQYVYLSDTVYVGYTKKKVKWLVYWNDPDAKNYSAYSEQWCYDWSGDGLYDAYLYFRNGKVSNWQIFD